MIAQTATLIAGGLAIIGALLGSVVGLVVEKSCAGRVVLGGCILFPDSPDHRCGSCGHE